MKNLYILSIFVVFFFFGVNNLKSDKYNMDAGELEYSIFQVRTKYPLHNTIFPDLEKRLYGSSKKTKQHYNPDIMTREKAIRDLILLAKHELAKPGDKPPYRLPLSERSALAHLGTLAISYLKAREELTERTPEGLKLMEFYIQQGLPSRQEEYFKRVRMFETYGTSLDWLIDSFRTISRGVKEEARKEKAKWDGLNDWEFYQRVSLSHKGNKTE